MTMSLPQLSDEFIAGALTYPAVREAIDQAFLSLAQGRAAIQARSRVECGAFRLSTMGAVWTDARLALVKTYGTVQGRFDFVCNLFDAESGAPLAVMQGNELTRVRTPALTSIAVARAAQAHRRLAVFGAGVQGRAHIEALLQAFDFEEVTVVDTQDVSDWCRSASRRWDRRIVPGTPEQAVRTADVVVTATRSKTPLFDGDWLQPGTLVAAVGTSLPNGSELDDRTLARASKVIVEWKPQSLAEAGEVATRLEAGTLDRSRIVDLGELPDLQGGWRSPGDDIVVFKAVGVALTDLAAASVAWSAWQQTEQR